MTLPDVGMMFEYVKESDEDTQSSEEGKSSDLQAASKQPFAFNNSQSSFQTS